MNRERPDVPIAAFSKDGRFMHIDATVAPPAYLRFLLNSLGQSETSIFKVSIYTRDGVDTLDSRNIFSGDPEGDEAYIEKHVEDLLDAEYVEIERFAVSPTRMNPDIEYQI